MPRVVRARLEGKARVWRTSLDGYGSRSAPLPYMRFSMNMDGVMVALNPPRIDFVPIQQAIAKLKLEPRDSDFVLVARALDIAFGDGG
jgi:hypothetical protein